MKNLKDLKEQNHCTEPKGALRKDAGLCCGPRLRKGEVFAYVGLPQNLKDLNLKDPTREPCASLAITGTFA